MYDLHEHDQDHDGVCHYIGAEALKAVADRHVAEPAAAVNPMMTISVRVIAPIMLGSASTNITRKIICVLLAPKLFAASITPLSTSSSALSMRRAIKGAEPMVSGTIAAVVPILVLTRSFVIWRYEISD